MIGSFVGVDNLRLEQVMFQIPGYSLREVKGRCGTFAPMIQQLADDIEIAFRTGAVTIGETGENPLQLFTGFALLLEKAGKQSAAVELVLIAKDVQDLMKS